MRPLIGKLWHRHISARTSDSILPCLRSQFTCDLSQPWLSEVYGEWVIHVPCPRGTKGKMEESLVSGEGVPGSQFTGDRLSAGEARRHCTPETLCNPWLKVSAKGLHWSIGLGPVICQQAGFGRRQGHKDNCNTSHGFFSKLAS